MPKKPRQKKTATKPLYAIVRKAVDAHVSVLPDYTEILDSDGWAAAEDAFIAEFIDESNRDNFVSSAAIEARRTSDEHAFAAALPEALQDRFRDYCNRISDVRWIHEEITYALGVEVGRRMLGVR